MLIIARVARGPEFNEFGPKPHPPAGMSGRSSALLAAAAHVDGGAFTRDLARRVAYRTESCGASNGAGQRAYLEREMADTLARLGFGARLIDRGPGGLFMLGHRHEGGHLPTVLLYGHGDTVPGMTGHWAGGRDPSLSPAERMFAGNTLEVVAMGAGNLAQPAAPSQAMQRPC